jgi:hypothetical protein
MEIKKVVERSDGSVVFQGKLEGPELAFVIECGLDAIFQMTASPFLSTETTPFCDIHELPDGEQ